MNCPKCGTPAQAGASHCRRCGSALSAKAAAAASSSDEYELMPLEESKAPAHSSFEPPPDLPPPPPMPGAKAKPAVDPRGPEGPPPPDGKIRGAMAIPKKSNVNTLIGAAVVGLVLAWILWLVFRTKDEVVVGKPKSEYTALLQPNQTRVDNYSVTGLVPYTFEISVVDGEMLVGVVQRSHKDPTNMAGIKKLIDPLETLKKGDTRTFTGEFKHKEQYSWVLANDSKKPARAKVKLLAGDKQ